MLRHKLFVKQRFTPQNRHDISVIYGVHFAKYNKTLFLLIGLHMILRFLDKLLFGVALIAALQIPQLADHYHQYLSGLHSSTQWQIKGYEATAATYEYANAKAMIEHHLQNDVPSVRMDAQQKLATLDQFEDIQSGITIFNSGNLLEKTLYMFNPENYQYLSETLTNYKLGIPLTLEGFIFGITVGLLVNLLISLPFVLFIKSRKLNKHRVFQNQTNQQIAF